MRGGDERSGSLFSYVDLEARVERPMPMPSGFVVYVHLLGGIARLVIELAIGATAALADYRFRWR